MEITNQLKQAVCGKGLEVEGFNPDVKAHPSDSAMKQKFTAAVLDGNINGFTGQICRLPRRERNRMLAEWIPYVLRNAKLYQPSRTVMAFDRLPLPVFDLFIYIRNKIRN